MVQTPAPAVRIGVAIAVPEPHASLLREHRASFGDVQAASVPTHVTLVPPISVAVDALDEVESHLVDLAARHTTFEMRLRGTDSFRPVSPVVFVVVAQGGAECELLAKDMRTGPLEMRLEFPYHPHVTVAHHLDDVGLDHAAGTLATYACDYDVGEFVLYAHDPEDGWLERRVFALRDVTGDGESPARP